MRMAAAMVPPRSLSAVLLTHLHSDHITDLNDVITTHWVSTFEPTTLRIVGPPGTRDVVAHILDSLDPDIQYRTTHHEDLNNPPIIDVTEVKDGVVGLAGAVRITAGPTDHRPVEPTVGYRFDHDDASVVIAGDTVPCEGLDRLCAGAKALVHSAIRKDIIAHSPVKRLVDTLDYHSSPEEAAETAARASMETLVLTHYVPPIPAGGDGADWRERAAAHFDGRIELGDDLLRIEVPAPS
jgi:ribonuclease Z